MSNKPDRSISFASLPGRLIILLVIIGFTSGISAHDIRPAYLQVDHDSKRESLTILWKVSLFSNPNEDLYPEITDISLDFNNAVGRISENARIWKWTVSDFDNSINGRFLTINGLDLTLTDVMVKICLDGAEQVFMLTPETNSLIIGEKRKTGNAVLRYSRLGIEHIMLGIDHLLFVLGLLLLSRTKWLLIKTISSFTVGHSISLALATLGYIFIPVKPLSTVIALSIVFLAWELTRARHGKDSLTIRNPWLVSFFFGMIHGIGFAGGLVQLGLPESEIPIALLFFNVGVEIGQLLFIFLVISFLAALRKMEFHFPRRAVLIPAYTIGSFASFWFLGRLIAIF